MPEREDIPEKEGNGLKTDTGIPREIGNGHSEQTGQSYIR